MLCVWVCGAFNQCQCWFTTNHTTSGMILIGTALWTHGKRSWICMIRGPPSLVWLSFKTSIQLAINPSSLRKDQCSSREVLWNWLEFPLFLPTNRQNPIYTPSTKQQPTDGLKQTWVAHDKGLMFSRHLSGHLEHVAQCRADEISGHQPRERGPTISQDIREWKQKKDVLKNAV